ncbi:MAG: nuclear transport factor 2 family protein [Actinomycetota bacterium]|nr:nuclear transport factor 2 family protein [Actinomycetota bacterium]
MTLTDAEIAATLRRLADAFNRGDYEGSIEIAHPEIELVRAWEKSSLYGTEALQAWLKPDAFENQSLELLDLTISGGKVLVNQRFRARGAGSGMDVEVDSWAVWTLDEAGLATKLELFLRHEENEAREAAGLAASA